LRCCRSKVKQTFPAILSETPNFLRSFDLRSFDRLIHSCIQGHHRAHPFRISSSVLFIRPASLMVHSSHVPSMSILPFATATKRSAETAAFAEVGGVVTSQAVFFLLLPGIAMGMPFMAYQNEYRFPGSVRPRSSMPEIAYVLWTAFHFCAARIMASRPTLASDGRSSFSVTVMLRSTMAITDATSKTAI